jgi:hypothetical protein
MLNLSNTSELAEGFNELNIVPFTISYEIEPCGISKIDELYKKQTEGFEKTQEDDLRSMGHGLVSPKGRVHFAFGTPVNQNFEFDSPGNIGVGEQIDKLAEFIDRQIYLNYKLWPNNYIAEDLLNDSKANTSHYTEIQHQHFTNLMDQALNRIEGHKQVIRKMFLMMYANPLLNYRKAIATQKDADKL